MITYFEKFKFLADHLIKLNILKIQMLVLEIGEEIQFNCWDHKLEKLLFNLNFQVTS